MKDSSCDQETSAISSSIISQPDLDAVLGEFMRIRGFDNDVSIDTSVRYLARDVLVCETDDQSVESEKGVSVEGNENVGNENCV
jgi:hypothetical protein